LSVNRIHGIMGEECYVQNKFSIGKRMQFSYKLYRKVKKDQQFIETRMIRNYNL